MTLQEQRLYKFGPYRVDPAKRLVLRDGEVVPLTPKCFDILLVLVENSRQVVDKEGLMNRVWPDSFVEEGTLTYNVSILRKALGERAGEHQYVVTVPGRGYRFVAGVKEMRSESVQGKLEDERAKPLESAGAVDGSDDPWRSTEDEGALRRKAGDDLSSGNSKPPQRHAIILALVIVSIVSGVGFWVYKSTSRNKLPGVFQTMKITGA